MDELEKALWQRYGKENVRMEDDGRYYIRTIATSGRYVWHFMGVAK
jgi:hypothetical protein